MWIVLTKKREMNQEVNDYIHHRNDTLKRKKTGRRHMRIGTYVQTSKVGS